MRTRATCLTLAGALLALCPVNARAQAIGSYGPAAQERYNRRSQGVESIDQYVRDLASENGDERLQAVRSLGDSKEEKAVEYLVQAVGDSDARVSAKAIDMLGHMRATEAAPVLIQYLFLRTTDPQLKALILAALGKIGDDRAARPIVEFLQRDLDKATRGTGLFALGEIGSTDAEGALSWAAANDTDGHLRRLANEALVKVQSRRESLSAEARQPAEMFLRRDDQPPEQP